MFDASHVLGVEPGYRRDDQRKPCRRTHTGSGARRCTPDRNNRERGTSARCGEDPLGMAADDGGPTSRQISAVGCLPVIAGRRIGRRQLHEPAKEVFGQLQRTGLGQQVARRALR